MRLQTAVGDSAMRSTAFLRTAIYGIVVATIGAPRPFPSTLAADLPKARGTYVATGSLPCPNATQAAAADEKFVYAISDSLIVKYDRASGKELAKSTGPAQHLNSGFLWRGKLYC